MSVAESNPSANNPSSSKIRLVLVSELPRAQNEKITISDLEGEYTGQNYEVSSIPEITNPAEQPNNIDSLEDNKVYLGKQTLENGHVSYYFITNGMGMWTKLDNNVSVREFPSNIGIVPQGIPVAAESEEEQPSEGETPKVPAIQFDVGSNQQPQPGSNPQSTTNKAVNSSSAAINPSSAAGNTKPTGNTIPVEKPTGSAVNPTGAANPIKSTIIAQTQEQTGNLAGNLAGNQTQTGNQAGNQAQTETNAGNPAVNPTQTGNLSPAGNPVQGGGSRLKRKYSFKSKNQMKNKLVKRTMKK